MLNLFPKANLERENENEKFTFNNIKNSRLYYRNKKSSKTWVNATVMVIVSIVVFLTVIALIFFVVRKRNLSSLIEQNSSKINFNSVN